jgi:alpha-galactosidase
MEEDNMRLGIGGVAVAALTISSAAHAVAPTPSEMAIAARFAARLDSRNIQDGRKTLLPFSFRIGDRLIDSMPEGWSVKSQSARIDSRRMRCILTMKDPKSGLTAKCVSVQYADYPVVEWTLYLKNTGSADSPIVTDLFALDERFIRPANGAFVLHHPKGTTVAADDFAPRETTLGPNDDLKLAPNGGRPCGGVWPYMNLQGPKTGAVIAIGWPGHWSAEFKEESPRRLRVTAGQDGVRFTLHPGEQVRSPLIALLFYTGEPLRAQNLWRRWMVAHNIPRPGGKLPPPQMNGCSSHQFGEMIHANRDNQILFIDRYVSRGLKPDYWWMDAGWYVNASGWPNTGTWEVDTNRFPGGLRAITDHAHAKGIKSIVWFEPERVTPGTWLYDNHPEWLLGKDGEQKLLDLGNPAARAWLTDHIDQLLTSQGIDLYRQDYNVDPLPYWRGADAPNRSGIAENHYCSGYLAYWDELRRRRPNMLIDSCASGGHRNDLETMRRSVPLLRSDHIQDAVGNQGHTFGLACWIPFNGTGTDQTGTYELQSSMAQAGFTPCWDQRVPDLDYAQFRKLVADWRAIAPLYYLADFYPLTPYNLDADKWIAWQWNSPERDEGAVQAYRRDKSPDPSMVFKLKALNPSATYVVKDLNTGQTATHTGHELMQTGIAAEIPNQPGAVWLTYRLNRQ